MENWGEGADGVGLLIYSGRGAARHSRRDVSGPRTFVEKVVRSVSLFNDGFAPATVKARAASNLAVKKKRKLQLGVDAVINPLFANARLLFV